VYLTPKDIDRLLLFLAAELARKRRAKGLRLTCPEALALIADEVVEAARAGATVPEATVAGSTAVSENDLLPGVAALIGTVQVEGFFEDGQKLVTIHDPVRPGEHDAERAAETTVHTPGEVLPAEGDVVLNAGRQSCVLRVINTGDRPVQVGSHFHFFEVNRALAFDRAAAFGTRLDIPAGTAVRFEPGQEHEVALVALGGSAEVFGLNQATEGPTRQTAGEEAVNELRRRGFSFLTNDSDTPASSVDLRKGGQ